MQQADEEDRAEGLDQRDGREVADVEVVDSVLQGARGLQGRGALSDLDDSGCQYGHADAGDGNHEGPEDGQEDGADGAAQRVHQDLVAEERQAGLLDLRVLVGCDGEWPGARTSQRRSASALAIARFVVEYDV